MFIKSSYWRTWIKIWAVRLKYERLDQRKLKVNSMWRMIRYVIKAFGLNQNWFFDPLTSLRRKEPFLRPLEHRRATAKSRRCR